MTHKPWCFYAPWTGIDWCGRFTFEISLLLARPAGGFTACTACDRRYCLHGLRFTSLFARSAIGFTACMACNRHYCLHGLRFTSLFAWLAIGFTACTACDRLYCLHGLRFTSLFARPERPASTQPRASEAAPWVGSAREPTPYRGKSVVVRFAGYEYFCPFRAWLQLSL